MVGMFFGLWQTDMPGHVALSKAHFAPINAALMRPADLQYAIDGIAKQSRPRRALHQPDRERSAIKYRVCLGHLSLLADGSRFDVAAVATEPVTGATALRRHWLTVDTRRR